MAAAFYNAVRPAKGPDWTLKGSGGVDATVFDSKKGLRAHLPICRAFELLKELPDL
jgi:hypothetical protein